MSIEKNFQINPDEDGHFGIYGGRFIPETLASAIEQLTKSYLSVRNDKVFQDEFRQLLRDYVGRPTPLYFAERLSQAWGGARVYLKREDLNHTGAHKINNCVGQALLAKRMGKTRLIAETGAGQHGVATATIAARLGMQCEVYMGEADIARQQVNVYRMQLLGAKVCPVTTGSKTLKDALNEALRDWVANVDDTYYVIGTVAGPHPYPMMVRDFQAVIGEEARKQFQQQVGGQPNALVAAVGGGSNAIGLFYPFLNDEVDIYGVEAGGLGIDSQQHAAPLTTGRPGVLHGNRTYLMMDENGQIQATHSVSAGLDYPGVGPEHAWLKDQHRVNYTTVTDQQAIDAFYQCTTLEGIIPALESSHALAFAKHLASEMNSTNSIIVNLSGRGDKDIDTIRQLEASS